MGAEKFRDFVHDLTLLANEDPSEAVMLRKAKPLMSDLLTSDEWLPDEFAKPDPDRYSQYLLHCDPLERFSIVSFVWAIGQETPIHDHTVWGMIGVLRGSEKSQRFEIEGNAIQRVGGMEYLESGQIDLVSPTIGDIHKVINAEKGKSSVSIHVYGGNIGRIDRHSYMENGLRKDFVSGYTKKFIPNIWVK